MLTETVETRSIYTVCNFQSGHLCENKNEKYALNGVWYFFYNFKCMTILKTFFFVLKP